MNIELLRYVHCYRENFKIEQFEEKDSIFALAESGSFIVKKDNETFQVNPLEGVVFKKGIAYHRHILTPVHLHLFRYHSDTDFFKKDHIIFTHKDRISSTLFLLNHLNANASHDVAKFQKSLFTDIINQYMIEDLNRNPLKDKNDPQIETIIKYIHAHIHEKLVITELAYHTRLSYVQFLRRFEVYTGSTPIEYINTLKLEKAKDLLIKTDYKINEIAQLCGFDNEYYFSNFIKKQTGLSPSAFRKQNNFMF